MQGQEPFAGPLRLEIIATFPMPASWSKKRRAQGAEGTLWHTSRPDGDNILKAVGDGLNGVVWRDDACLASCEIGKRYGIVPGLQVEVLPL